MRRDVNEGVRLGATPLSDAAEEVGRVLLPYLRARVRAATAEIASLANELAREPRRALRDERGLARAETTRAELDRLGWCLGVLGAARGVDVLHARHARAGLRTVVDVLAEARGAREDPARLAELPELAPAAAWHAPLLCAWMLARAQTARPAWPAWSVRRDGRLWFEVEASDADALAERCARYARALAGAIEWQAGASTLAIGLPESWLEARRGRRPRQV